jgi:hypothetical protein
VRSLAAVTALVAGCSFSSPKAGTGAIDAPDGDAPAGAGDAPNCPAGFAAVNGAPSRYLAMTTARAFASAAAACAALGPRVHLARLDSQAETTAIFGLVDGAIVGPHMAIYRVVGARHLNGPGPADDTWHDLDNVAPLAFLPWGQSEPTSLAGESCMSVRNETSGAPPPKIAGADDCTTPRPFACECE